MPKVSVVIPTLNEVEAIGAVLSEIPKNIVDEVLVVDGGSTDGTVELVKKLGYQIYEEEGRGFGAAFSTGARKATGDIVVFLNSDHSHDPKEIVNFLDKIEEGYDMVMASRYLPGAKSDDDSFLHFIGNKFFTLLSNVLHRAKFSDILYFYLAARKEVFEKVPTESMRFEYCIELPIKAHKAGFKIIQVPAHERKRMGGKAKVNAIREGISILWAILKY